MLDRSLAALTLLCATALAAPSVAAQCLVERFASPSGPVGVRFGAELDGARFPLFSGGYAERSIVTGTRAPTHRALLWRGRQRPSSIAVDWDPPVTLDTGIPDVAAPGDDSPSVATDGHLVAVGVRAAPGGGEVHLFAEGSSGWSRIAVVSPPPGSGAEHFGASVDVYGRTLVVGAPRTDAGGFTDAGAIFLFEQRAGAWTMTQRIDPLVAKDDGVFGSDVELESTILAFTESRSETPGARVFVYSYTLEEWRFSRTIEEEVTDVEVGRNAVYVGIDRITDVFPQPISGVRVFRNVVPTARPNQTIITSLDVGGAPARISAGHGRLALLMDDGQVRLFGLDSFNFDEFWAPIDSLESGSGLVATDVEIVWDSVWTGHARPAAGPPGGAAAETVAWHYSQRSIAGYPFVRSGCGGTGTALSPDPRLEPLAGCSTLLRNDLVLEARGLPPGEVVLLLAGNLQGDRIPVLGGAAELCLGDTIGRFAPRVVPSGGRVFFPVDVERVPGPTGVGPATAGTAISVQAIARDSASPNGGVLTNALQLLVE
ncbi:MAG: FG-GAP repeat protein [Planctomycetota bacterium]